jgi:phosphatidylserine synthase
LVLAATLSFLMVSPIRFTKFPLLSFKKGRSNNLRLVGLFIILVTLIFYRGLVLFPLMTLYIFWSIIQWMLNHDRLEGETQIHARQNKYHE